ncbi:MAG: hypothetical protein ABH850_07335 [Candidatus Micrarchaeota archaeon]
MIKFFSLFFALILFNSKVLGKKNPKLLLVVSSIETLFLGVI